MTTERPGFGASTRLPGRRFREHADDLAEVLDHLGLDRVHLTGGSGAAPHELALCQYHPDRVVAATVVAGIAPFRDDEIDTMIPINAQVARLARAGRRDEVAACSESREPDAHLAGRRSASRNHGRCSAGRGCPSHGRGRPGWSRVGPRWGPSRRRGPESLDAPLPLDDRRGDGTRRHEVDEGLEERLALVLRVVGVEALDVRGHHLQRDEAVALRLYPAQHLPGEASGEAVGLDEDE